MVREGVIWYASMACGKVLRQPVPQCDCSKHPAAIESQKPLLRAPALRSSKYICLSFVNIKVCGFRHRVTFLLVFPIKTCVPFSLESWSWYTHGPF